MRRHHSIIQESEMRIAGLLAVSAMLAAGGAVADSKPKPGQVFVTGGVSYADFDDERNVDDDAGWTFGVGYRINELWGVEGVYTDIAGEQSRGNGDADVLIGRVDVLRFLAAGDGWLPYLAIGAGRLDAKLEGSANNDDDLIADFGAGVMRRVGERFSLRADARGLYGFDNNDVEPLLTLGFTVAVGPEPAPRVLDSDGDGVPDASDKCPGTRPGAVVDRDGCEPKQPAAPVDGDADGDGVPDSRDACPNTPRGTAVDERGCPTLRPGEVVRIELLLEFDYDKADLRPEHLPEIQRVVDFMRKYPSVQAVLEGHTDARGSDAYNQSLSERRANAVLRHMVDAAGVAAGRLSAVGRGETAPVASNDTDEGRQRNRRVVAVITAAEQPSR
jgi:OOP family OmpA-OmpF porin